MVRCAITSGEYGLPHAKTPPLLDQIRRLTQSVPPGIDLIQLREKHLPPGELARLAREILALLAAAGSPIRLLINTRADVALATAAHGVHLPSPPGGLTPTQIRTLYRTRNLPRPLVSKACHTLAEVLATRQDPPDLILFSPVFGKSLPGAHLPGTGLPTLATACAFAHPTPVLALGGITPHNTPACLQAGAAGIAGIRTFQEQLSVPSCQFKTNN